MRHAGGLGNHKAGSARSAHKTIELSRIAKPERSRLVEAIDRLAQAPLRGASLKGELRGPRRLRVRDHHIAYEVQDRQLIVRMVRIRHRRDHYR